MVVKRQYSRHIVKLPATIKAGGVTLEVTTVRLSKKGLFARTQKPFVEGTPVEITLTLPNDLPCVLKGVVKYTRHYDIMPRQNGMGLEFTERNEVYEEFISGFE